jgi:hypothetical protein
LGCPSFSLQPDFLFQKIKTQAQPSASNDLYVHVLLSFLSFSIAFVMAPMAKLNDDTATRINREKELFGHSGSSISD